MNKSQLNVPKLRFKGFDDEWIFRKILGINIDSIATNLSDYFLDAPAIMSKKYSIFNNEIYSIAPFDSIVFIKDGSNAGSFFYNEVCCRIASTCSFLFTNENNKFIYYILEKLSKHIKKELLTGETIPHLYKKDILKLGIIVCGNKIEQQKISKFFTLLDKQIELWERKLQLNELIKKYYLNQLFINSLKCCAAPKLRFGKFNHKWMMIKLYDISKVYTGSLLSKNDTEKNSIYPCILYGQIFTTYKKPLIDVKQIISYTNKNISSSSKGNDLLFPTSSTTLNQFFPCVAIKMPNVKLGGDMVIFEINKSNDSVYFHYLFSKWFHQKELFRLAEGSTINHLYKSYILGYKFYSTNNSEEQNKISKFFFSLDEISNKINANLSNLMKVKKYYLHNLFI